jgi:hypothetical protein
MGLTLRILDEGHRFGLMNNFIIYFEINTIEIELCGLD